ncbi:hypothetical protein [Mahella australiensis]|uniref:Uncharacterized protein n=1 Tax=Mahella australiensis (strain DSM 15567 / CIP 107919 / 50-1 BON) TaxID=697281 RepID=F4A0M0_MAHA5|nr:hypothetical protein [Mahella australiensis]AEE95899.1 hypothetical protein Mahau_0697 [Mahella australiensis 50-1 BON]
MIISKYSSIGEFVEELKSFYDIKFEYNGRAYSICPINGVYVAGEANGDDQTFKTIEGLINNFKLDGKPLKNVILEVKILVR